MNRSPSTIDDCRMLTFDAMTEDRRYLIQPLRNHLDIPFAVRRMYYIFDIPQRQTRGAHAHKDLHQIVIAINGRFTLKLHDGQNSKIVALNSPGVGLYIVPGIWRDVYDFTPGATCIVLASEPYNESDYLRDYQDFLDFKRAI